MISASRISQLRRLQRILIVKLNVDRGGTATDCFRVSRCREGHNRLVSGDPTRNSGHVAVWSCAVALLVTHGLASKVRTFGNAATTETYKRAASTGIPPIAALTRRKWRATRNSANEAHKQKGAHREK